MNEDNRGLLNRRDALKTIGAIGGAVAASNLIPNFVQAATGQTLTSPPVATSALSNTTLANGYLTALRALPDHSAALLPHQLYALNAETRTDIAIADVTLTATAYTDAASTANTVPPVVGPTFEFIRGKTTGVWLQNTITVCGPVNDMMMTNPVSGWKPHGFTTTNLHTHGLHVTPQAPSDDVLLMIRSTSDTSSMMANLPTDYPYFYTLPDDHPVGTFWYHPHKHGAVASQVGPGMAGALIVRSGASDNDFDDLLAAAPYNITADDEEIVVLQTIPYYYSNTAKTEAIFYPIGYYQGGVPDPSTCGGLTLTAGPSSTPTSVNGVIQPNLDLVTGQIKRLRLVNASNGQTYVPKFRVAGNGGSTALPKVYAIAVDGIALLPTNGVSESALNQPYFEIDYTLTEAADATAYWTTAELITLAPGQRLDILIEAPEAGTFELYGAAIGEAPMVVQSDTPNTDTILTLTVTSGTPAKSQQIPPMSLYAASTIQRPVSPDTGMTGPSLPPATQTLEFKTIGANFGPDGETTAPPFVINGQHFDGDLDDPAQLQLFKGDTDVWNLYSTNEAHIFHIHINSFAAFARVPYDVSARTYKAPVFYSMPIWRDTIYFDGGPPPGNTTEPQFTPGTMVVTASKQVDFTGEFVLHCHNLFHEDNGMMLTVSVEDPTTGKFDPT